MPKTNTVRVLDVVAESIGPTIDRIGAASRELDQALRLGYPSRTCGR